jgi:chorismate mutase
VSFELSDLREQIQRLDDQLIDLLAQRQAVSVKIGVIKQQTNATVEQPEIWKKQCAYRENIAQISGVSAELVGEVFECIHRYSKAIQQKQVRDE